MSKITTPPKFNVEPEHGWFPKGISFSRDFFSGSMLNFRGVGGGFKYFFWSFHAELSGKIPNLTF